MRALVGAWRRSRAWSHTRRVLGRLLDIWLVVSGLLFGAVTGIWPLAVGGGLFGVMLVADHAQRRIEDEYTSALWALVAIGTCLGGLTCYVIGAGAYYRWWP